ILGNRARKVKSLTLADVARGFQLFQEELNLAALRGNVSVAIDKVPKAEPGSVLLRCASHVVDLIKGGARKVDEDVFHIKICIDDCEVLKPPQRVGHSEGRGCTRLAILAARDFVPESRYIDRKNNVGGGTLVRYLVLQNPRLILQL